MKFQITFIDFTRPNCGEISIVEAEDHEEAMAMFYGYTVDQLHKLYNRGGPQLEGVAGNPNLAYCYTKNDSVLILLKLD